MILRKKRSTSGIILKENPYQTPESDLTTNQAQMPKTLWWKLVFFTMALITPLAIVGFAISSEFKMSVIEYFDLSIFFIVLAGLFGLAFNKAIGIQKFWKNFFYVHLVVAIVVNVIFPFAGIETYGQRISIDIYFFVGILISALLVWATYLYGFKRPQIWESL